MKHINKIYQQAELSTKKISLARLAITLFWPAWLLVETYGEQENINQLLKTRRKTMTSVIKGEFSGEPRKNLPTIELAGNEDDKRPTQLRIRIQVPKKLTEEPVISRLIASHGLTVNVKAALLSSGIREDGWFDLEITGTNRQIQSGLIYLDELDVKIWHKSTDIDAETW
ncbi:MAG: hypothetical protein Fur0025_00170 [Oscillatoriaceae cyanobacterium]